MQEQLPLETLAKDIYSLVQSDGLLGFAGTEFDLTNQALILRWHGAVPLKVLTVLAVTPPGYSYEIRQANYSLVQLNQEIARLGQVSTDVPISRIGPLTDYSGLVVGVAIDEGVPLPTIASSVPITVIREPSGAFLARQSDSPPFYGGSRLNYQGLGLCTDGFIFQKVPSGTKGISTAEHCGENRTFTNGSNDHTVGTSGGCCYSIDTTLITGYTYDPHVYTGAWNSGTNVTVHDAGYVSVGQLVCAGGSYSGESCGARVTAVNQTFNGRGPGYFAQRDDHSPLAGHGDSGGPSYTYYGGSALSAYGMVDQGQIASSSCRGVAMGTCYYAVFFVNVENAATSLQALVVVA